MNNLIDYPLFVFALALFGLWLSSHIGFSFLRKRRKLDEDMREDFGVIQSATLTLLGLIIGFTFSMAIGRFEQRKNYEEAEANAIGHRLRPGRPAAGGRRGESAFAALGLPRSAYLVLPNPRSPATSPDQYHDGSVAE